MQKTYTCKNCGKRVRTAGWADDLFIERLCFDCHFWLPKTQMSDKQMGGRIPLRANGVHRIAVMGEDGPFKGYGGATFVFEFIDGRIGCFANVWHQGDIPAKWRDKLPDNGRFLTADEVKERNLFPGLNMERVSSFV
jgi:hypothetical protein